MRAFKPQSERFFGKLGHAFPISKKEQERPPSNYNPGTQPRYETPDDILVEFCTK